MSEPDSTPRRRAPTIDLTASEVATEPADSTQSRAAEDAAPARAPGDSGANFRKRARPYAVGVIAGAVFAAAIIAGFWLADLLPARAPALSPGVQAVKPVGAGEASSRLDQMQQALPAPRQSDTLAGRVAAAEAQTQALGGLLAALTRRVDEVAAASQSALAQSKAAAEATKAVDALDNRLAALESAVKSLAADIAQATARADDRAARMTIAAEALRATVERGAPYQGELAAVKALGADANATAALDPFATSGIPSASALARELNALAPALQRAAEPASTDGSFIARLENSARKLVRVTPIDAAQTPPAAANEDPTAVVARIKADAARDDIAAALADIERLPDKARALADAWVKKTQMREQALDASRRILDAALAALGKSAAQ